MAIYKYQGVKYSWIISPAILPFVLNPNYAQIQVGNEYEG